MLHWSLGSGEDKKMVIMQFMLPANYNKVEDAPKPTNERMVITKEGERKYGAVRFWRCCNRASSAAKSGEAIHCGVNEGKAIHCRIMRLGLDCNVNVLNSLIHYYMSSNRFVSYACELFDKNPERTVATVNSMLFVFLKNEKFDRGDDFSFWVY